MYKYILESTGNINWLALFALITFFTVFFIGAYLALKKDTRLLDHMSALPLEDDE